MDSVTEHPMDTQGVQHWVRKCIRLYVCVCMHWCVCVCVHACMCVNIRTPIGAMQTTNSFPSMQTRAALQQPPQPTLLCGDVCYSHWSFTTRHECQHCHIYHRSSPSQNILYAHECYSHFHNISYITLSIYQCCHNHLHTLSVLDVQTRRYYNSLNQNQFATNYV